MMIPRLQKYTIFFTNNRLLLLPLLAQTLVRSYADMVYSSEYLSISFLSNFLLPLFIDGGLILLALSIFSNRKLLLMLLNLISIYFFISTILYIHHLKLYITPPGAGAIAALFETTPLEALEFTKISSISSILHTILLSSLVFIWIPWRKRNRVERKRTFLTSALFMILATICGAFYTPPPKIKLSSIDQSHMFRDLKNIYHYTDEYYSLISLREKRANKTFDAKQNKRIDQEKQVHLLIIGESLSRNHMSVYGYNRPTTPYLDTLSNALFFSNVISPTTQTRSAIVRLLTPAFGLNTKSFYENGSITTALNDAGFSSYWISNQGKYGISDTETTVLADDADENIFVNTSWNNKSLDEKLIPPLKTILEKDEKKQFIVLHLLGSHFEYEKRVPEEYLEIFGDDGLSDNLELGEKKRVNQYDATVRYTDWLLFNLIQIIKKRNSISSITFLSDHGEDIYDDQRKLLGHGSPIVTRYTVEIPFMIWYSSKMKDQIEMILDNIDLNKFYNSGNAFHTLCQLYQLNLKEFEEDRSIFFNGESSNDYPYIINSNGLKIDYRKLKEE